MLIKYLNGNIYYLLFTVTYYNTYINDPIWLPITVLQKRNVMDFIGTELQRNPNAIQEEQPALLKENLVQSTEIVHFKILLKNFD